VRFLEAYLKNKWETGGETFVFIPRIPTKAALTPPIRKFLPKKIK